MDYFDTEYDIKPYIRILLKNWWRIGVVAVFFAILGSSVVYFQSETYIASANIIIKEESLQLLLSEQFRTVDDTIALQSRSESFLTIATSDDIAKKTLDALSNKLPEEQSTIRSLKEIVDVSSNGEIINISVSSKDADLAAEIANTWADTTISSINQAFNSTQPLQEVQGLISEKQIEYTTAQDLLEEFYAENTIISLQTELNLLQSSLNNLSIEFSNELNLLLSQKQELLMLKISATNLSEYLSDTNSPSLTLGETLAIIDIERSIVSKNTITEQQAPIGNAIYLSLSDTTLTDYTRSTAIDDLENIITVANERTVALDKNINTLISSELISDNAEEIQFITTQIQRVQTELENETALEKELINSRDLTLETYNAVIAKESELRTLATTDNKVALVNPAIIPDEPQSKGTMMNTLIAGIIGGIISVTWVLIRYWWNTNDDTNQ